MVTLLMVLLVRQSPDKIELGFVPSDFIVTSDGEFVVALHRAAGEAVFVSLPDRRVERTVRVGGRPSALAEVDGRVWVGDGEGATIQIVDGAKVRLPSARVGSIVVSRTGRVFVSTSKHIVEVDPGSREPVFALADAEEPASLAVRPDGELLYVIGGAREGIWRTGVPFEQVSAERIPDGTIPDGQGHCLVGPQGVYDAYLGERRRHGELHSEILVHPDAPAAIFVGGRGPTVKALDLYRLGFGPIANYEASIREDPRRNVRFRARLAPDARSIFYGAVQAGGDEAEGPASIFVLESPLKETPGYFAFTSLPPRAVHPGFAATFALRLSAPFEGRAEISVEYKPESMEWLPDSRELRWTPGAADVGRSEVRVRATDSVTGMTLDHTIVLAVELKKVLADCYSSDIGLSGTGRFLYAKPKRDSDRLTVYDFETDREYGLALGFRPEQLADTGTRLYAWDRVQEKIVSWKLADGTDRHEHALKGYKIERLVPQGTTGTMLVVGGNTREPNERSELVSPADGTPDVVATFESGAGALTVAPDGRLMVGRDGVGITLHRFQDGRYKKILDTGGGSLSNPRFSADGKFLSDNMTLYDVRTMRAVRSPGKHVLDRTGAFYMVGSDVYALESFDRLHRVSVPRQFNPHALWPISARGRIAVLTDRGVFLLPHDFKAARTGD